MEKFSLFQPGNVTYSASTFPDSGYLEMAYPRRKCEEAHVNAPTIEKGEGMDDLHIPIGAGDHVLKTLLARHPCKPKVCISTTALPTDRILEVRMTDADNHVCIKKALLIDDLEHFSAYLDAMDGELSDYLEDGNWEDAQWTDI